MSRTKSHALNGLALHAQLCVHYALMIADLFAGPKPGIPDPLRGVIPFMKELKEGLDETIKGLSQFSSRLISVRTGVFQYGDLVAHNACTAAFLVAWDVMEYVRPVLAHVSDGEMGAANWLFQNWDDLAKSFRDHRGYLYLAGQDHKHFELLVDAEIVWETEKAAQPETAQPEVPPEQVSPEARAIALMMDHHQRTGKLMTVQELLARMPGVGRSALYAKPVFVAAREAIKKGNPPPKGYKAADGTIEARADDDQAEEE